MWAKAQAIWRLMATTFLDDYDYFVIGGDDLYVLVENLREYLGSPEVMRLSQYGRKPVYLGRPLRANAYQIFNSGGSGYVLNAAAVALLNELMDRAECLPTITTSMEDLMVGQCVRLAGVRTVDTKHPVDGRQRFHPMSPRDAYWANASWYTRMAVDYGRAEDCCSPYSISFQDIRGWPNYMNCLHRRIYCVE
jgi:glycoprotein-N-acetylgalactosamine 3-beta-galactosyltransferase